MKTNITQHSARLLRFVSASALALAFTATALAQGTTAFTYQGRLNDGANPATGTYDLRFTLYDTAGGPGTAGSPVPKLGTGVTNGLFTVTLDFGAGLFNGAARWLEIAAKTNGAATYVTLTPRQALTPTPYALFAPSAGSLSGNVNQAFTGTVSFSPPAGPPFAVGSTNAVANLNADLLDGRHAASFWQLGGNAGTTPGSFLGTTDNQPLELRVNGALALRLEYAGTAGIFGLPYPNLIAGSSSVINSLGSSIGGGDVNQIAGAADFSFLGGGDHNTIAANSTRAFLGGGGEGTIGTNSTYAFLGGGQNNSIQANARHAFLGGGENNNLGVTAFHSFLGGGAENTIQRGARKSFLGGGYQNQIQTDAAFAVLGGGNGNWIGAEGGMVPGGRGNFVGGMYSFAAGYRAKAPLPGCFVWADANAADFNTGVANSFNVRSTGGLYFVTGLNPDGSPARTTTLRDGQGIALPAADAPMLTCGWDPFTSGPKAGVGRWGMFMEPAALCIGIPDASLGYRELVVSSFVADGTRGDLFRVGNNGDVGIIGNLRVRGEIEEGSDRNLKENFAPINPREVLDKVAALPLSQWNYKTKQNSPHIGPMAQDFKAAFGLGSSDTSICTVDADGVALAAIQGLNQKLEQTVQEKNAKIETLEARLAALEKLVSESLKK
jgi:hypothetical protein